MATPGAAQHFSILVVEDDADLRDSLCEVLGAEDYQAVAAANGKEALDYLASHPLPRLLLLDLMMPVMSGPELRERMLQSERLRGVPVVVLSALDLSRQESSVAGASAYLKKPIDPEELLQTLARLLRPGAAIPPSR